jgi:hypothetical protein
LCRATAAQALEQLGRERAPLALRLVLEGRVVVELAEDLAGAHAARVHDLGVDAA